MEATIMIPAYNVGEFLDKALESTINQTFKGSYEIIIVNDGSTDNTKEIAEFYKKKNPKIILINQENKGIGNTRNKLLKKAKGNILVGLDGDDKLCPTSLEEIVNFFKYNSQTSFVYTNQEEIDENGKKLRIRNKQEVHKHFYKLILHSHFPGHLRAYNKNRLDNIEFDSNLSCAEDYDFLLKVLSSNWPNIKTGFISKILYSYRKNSKSISITSREEMNKIPINILTKHITKMKLYNDKNFKVIPINKGNNVFYYNHIIDGKSTMGPKAREVLEGYLKN